MKIIILKINIPLSVYGKEWIIFKTLHENMRSFFYHLNFYLVFWEHWLKPSIRKVASFQHFLGAVFFIANHFKASWKTPWTFSLYFLSYCCWWASRCWEDSLLLYRRSACFSCLVPLVLSFEIIPHSIIPNLLWCYCVIRGTGCEKKLIRNMLMSCLAVSAIAVVLRWLLMRFFDLHKCGTVWCKLVSLLRSYQEYLQPPMLKEFSRINYGHLCLF